MRPARLAVTLTAHGSRDPRAAQATEALTRAVRERHPEWEVHASYLDHAGPRPRAVLSAFAEAGHHSAVLVPLLLTSAYHGRVDVPAEIAAVPDLAVAQADVLGPVDGQVPSLLLDALVTRLGRGGAPLDAVVLAAAGTRNAAARATVDLAAAALGARLGVPSRVAYASAAPPLSGDAVRELQGLGHHRIGLASYFLAPGLLWDSTVASAREAGVCTVASPLTDEAGVVELVAGRVLGVAGRRAAAAAVAA